MRGRMLPTYKNMLPRFGSGAVDGDVPRSQKVKTSKFDFKHDIA